MDRQTFGATIASMRKEKGMTQLELAEMMGVTDKAVSKWERDLSFPDISSLPKLAEVFDVSVDELIKAKSTPKESVLKSKAIKILQIACKAIALAMGVAVVVLSILHELDTTDAILMLGLGLEFLAVHAFIAEIPDRGV